MLACRPLYARLERRSSLPLSSLHVSGLLGLRDEQPHTFGRMTVTRLRLVRRGRLPAFLPESSSFLSALATCLASLLDCWEADCAAEVALAEVPRVEAACAPLTEAFWLRTVAETPAPPEALTP